MKKFPIRVFDSSTVFYKETTFFRYYRPELDTLIRIKLQILELYFLLCNSLLEISRICLFKPIGIDNINNILIYRTGSIGDNVVALPAINAIRTHFPQAKISILTSAGNTGYVSFENIASPELYDSVINYSGNTLFSLRSQLKGKYDLIIELPQFLNGFVKNIRNIIFFRIYCGIGHGFGWQVSNVHLFKNTQEQNVLYKNEVSILSTIIKKYLKINFEKVYKFKIAIDDKELVNDLIDKLLLKTSAGFNVFIIGANYPKNRWPISNFLQIAQNSFELSNRCSIIVGSKEDNLLINEILLPDYIINFCGKLTISQTTFLLSICKEVFSNDTGPMHIASAIGVKLNAFFSCKDFPGRWFPDLSNAKIYRSFDLPCSICFDSHCLNNYCLQNITIKSMIN